MFKIRINDANTSQREKDPNGYLIVKNNPIAKAGVFDYLECEVFSQGKKDKIVKVCRTFEDLEKNKDLFKGKPIKWEHYWVGKDGETQTADGAIFGDVRAEKPYLIADIIIYNKDLIELIEKGEIVELSPAYEANIDTEKGAYNGEPYECLQLLKSVNHLAVVETGRSGNDLRIQDSKKGDNKMAKIKVKDGNFISKLLKKLQDEDIIEKPNNTQDEDMQDNADELLNKVLEIAQGDNDSESKILAIVEALKATQEQKDEDTSKDTQDNDKEQEQKDEEIPSNKDNEITLSSEELVELIEKVADSQIKKLQDSLNNKHKAQSQAYKDVSNVLGTSFDFADKSADEIYKFGYECLTNTKLMDSMDSKTAFFAVSQVKQTNTQTKHKVTDSASNTKLNELIKLHRR